MATKAISPSKAKSPDIKEVNDIMRLSYELCRPAFDQANKDIELYEQVIDPATWSTMSEMTLGLAYRLVQNTLPNLLLNVLWSADNPFNLIPVGGIDGKTTMEIATKVRKYLIYNLRDRMDIDSRGYATILDGVKLGVGYGIIEPKTVYMAERQEITATTGEENARLVSLGLAEPKTIPSYRYVPFGSVLSTMDGATPDDASATTFVDTISEHSLRASFADKENDLEGNIEEIVKYACANGMDANTYAIRSIIAKLSGRTDGNHVRRYDTMHRNMKGTTLIPVTKQFVQNKHVWVACNRFVIRKTEKTVETLQCPLLKYNFSPEADNWFSKGIVAPNRDLMRNIETFENAMLDLFSISLHPHQVVNIDSLAEKDAAEDMAPYGKTFVSGDINSAQRFEAPPRLDPAVAGIGDRLSVRSDDLAGLNIPQGGALSPGIVRGGSGALETLMSSSTNREKVLAKHLENTWYKKLIQNTLIYSSIYASDEDAFNVVKTAEAESEGDRDIGEKYFEAVKITRSELSHVWRISINFRDKLRNFLAESAHRLQIYNLLLKDPDINMDELKRYLIADESQSDRLMSGVDREKRFGDLERLGNIESARQGINPQLPAGGTPAPVGAGGGEVPTI